MIRRPFAALVALAAALPLALSACSSSGSAGHSAHPSKPKASQLDDNQGGGPFQGAGVDPAQPRPNFTLTDTVGKTVNFSALTDKHPTMLYFGYTQCPDVCPESMADARLALEKVPAALAKETYVVFVTTDPKHDTGAVIAKWLGNFSKGSKAHWYGLRGSQVQIDAAQAAAHVTLAEDGGQTHSAQILLYGPDNYAHVTFLQSNNEQQQIAHDLPLVAAGRT